MNNNKNFNLMNDILLKFILSFSIKDDKRYKYEYYENIYFSAERN